jgi:predicted transcriptional regulator
VKTHAITVERDEEQLARLERVWRKTGMATSVAIADALVTYEDALEDNDCRSHVSPEQIAAIEAGVDDIKHGRTIPHAEVFAELRAKHGWRGL